MHRDYDSEVENYKKKCLRQEEEITFLRNQIAQEVKEKYAAYRRIAELTGSKSEHPKEDTE